jgi:hypothetical protein
LPCRWQAATYAERLAATYARLSKVLTPDELQSACDKHATVVENVMRARSSLLELRDDPLIKEMQDPLSKLAAIDTFNSVLSRLQRARRDIGDHPELLVALEACMELLQAIDALYGKHGHPEAHEAIVMRNVVCKPGALDVLAAVSYDTTLKVDGTRYTVLAPRRTHFGAVGPVFKQRPAGACEVRSGFVQAPERIGTMTSEPKRAIQEFRRATGVANTGDFVRIITTSMLKALANPITAKIPEPERLALGRFWTFVADEASKCRLEDQHSLVKITLLVHVEEEGTNGGCLYQMLPELTDLMWDRLVRSLPASDLEYFLANVERSVALMTAPAPQGAFLYFRLDDQSDDQPESDKPAEPAAEPDAESKRHAADALDTIDHAATKRPCRQSTV